MTNKQYIDDIKSLLESAIDRDGGVKGDFYSLALSNISEMRGMDRSMYESHLINMRSRIIL